MWPGCRLTAGTSREGLASATVRRFLIVLKPVSVTIRLLSEYPRLLLTMSGVDDRYICRRWRRTACRRSNSAERKDGNIVNGTEQRETPHLGIFWVVQTSNGEPSLLAAGCPIDQAESYGDCLTYGPGHYETWAQWRRDRTVSRPARSVSPVTRILTELPPISTANTFLTDDIIATSSYRAVAFSGPAAASRARR